LSKRRGTFFYDKLVGVPFFNVMRKPSLIHYTNSCPRDHGFYGPPKGGDGCPRAGAHSTKARGLPSWPKGGP
jgi:hypothetical protein